jgi:transcriptional regulator with XRE-family HTH domain
MNLAEKMKHLRAVEGELRGMNRPMTQVEIVKAMQEELGETISQAYLSQLERNKRHHLTASSRDILARFFKVHPGYLISDPPDFSTDLMTEVEQDTDRLPTWLTASAHEWRTDSIIHDMLQQLANVEEPRRYLALFSRLMSLSLEELEAIVNAVTDLDTHTDELEDVTIDNSISSMDMELFNIQLEQIARTGYSGDNHYNDYQEHEKN